VFPQMVIMSAAVPGLGADPGSGFEASPSPSPSDPALPWAAMSCTVSDEATGRRITLSGEIDVATSRRLTAVLAEELARATGPIVLDLAEVTFMDASGLRVVVDASHALAARGWRLILSRPSRSVIRLLTVTSMAQYFGVATTGDERQRG
jgi:anti-sigma B factor antagonist